ncbi:hypothetical protein [Massilia sp. TSP1-1-2]|uniref:hypothetical protein n=1 Tax=unclassified Massilia TaxID=2609279 RepID=UPI003CF402B4
MTQITLVLPYALPPSELAQDLVRALKTPALAALLSRAACRSLPFDDNLRALPHETWLSATLGLAPSGAPSFAAAAMRGFGLDPGTAAWFIINPAHIEIARSHLLMHDLRQLHLAEDHAKALFATSKPVFDELGKTLVYGDAQTWFMAAGDWATLHTGSPDAAVGQNLTDWLPTGPAAVEFRKLQNEVQMLWFEHPANVAREGRGLAAVNSFWPWGLSQGPATAGATPLFAATGVPSWLSAIATSPAAALPDPFSGKEADSMLVRGDLCQAAMAGDWSSWLGLMQRFEETLFAPTLAGLQHGRNAQLRLVIGNRAVHKAFITTKWAQKAFWRSPTLDRLLP